MPNQNTALVLLHIFNRPEVVIMVLNEISLASLKKLYIFSDTHGIDNVGEEELVLENRKTLNHIDWDCEVKILYQEKNLGTRYAIYEALNWFFKHESKGIVPEEDCLPNQSFFSILYCYAGTLQR